MGDWESIFKKKGKVFLTEAEGIESVIKLMKKDKAKKVLDLGCGSGRHAVMLAKAGFEVYATDISKTGLKITRKGLKEHNLKAILKEASCYNKFPFKDGFFDAVISTQVIHHNYHDKVKFCISEIERVLKPGGVAFITVSASKSRRSKRIKQVASRTYIPLDGREKGLPHFIYTKALMIKDFSNFKILDLFKDKGEHYCLLGKLKK